MADVTNPLTHTAVATDVVKVAASRSGPAVTPAKKSPARQMPKWESETRDRVRSAVRRFAKPLADLIARDANEGDTRLLASIVQGF
jgi:hypothetical protein